MRDAEFGMQDVGLGKADQHLTMAALGLYERTEIWEMLKGRETVSSCRT